MVWTPGWESNPDQTTTHGETQRYGDQRQCMRLWLTASAGTGSLYRWGTGAWNPGQDSNLDLTSTDEVELDRHARRGFRLRLSHLGRPTEAGSLLGRAGTPRRGVGRRCGRPCPAHVRRRVGSRTPSCRGHASTRPPSSSPPRGPPSPPPTALPRGPGGHGRPWGAWRRIGTPSSIGRR